MTASGRESVLHAYDVSRETSARLDLLVNELSRWQRIKNLVGPDTLPEVWTRHIADSLQLLALEPQARRWLDLGSGAGFPGLVIAAALAGTAGAEVHLVESKGRKCAFLRHAARLMAAPAMVHEARIEAAVPGFAARNIEVVTARALAPLARLVAWTEPLLTTGTVGLFPKGREVQSELTEASKSWRLDADLIPSRTDSQGRIVRISSLREPA
ncbi:MAG TPA: 16S rRNA (guanine(527)-N(7))-methyltransferase RsmG [Beijerinckiaceae bacterium]